MEFFQDLVQRTFACNPEVARNIASRARLRAYRPRTSILQQGAPCVDAFLLVVGRVRALLVTRDGRLVQLYDYAPGDLFGALDAVAVRSQAAEITALDDVQAAVFRGMDFLALIEAHACIGLVLSRALIRRLDAFAEQMIARTTLSASGRIHAELLRLAEEGGSFRISPPPILSELALRVQSTRETVSRTISALERRAIINRDAQTLTILAPRRLEEMVI